jgi:hypothetical protein
MLSFDELQNGMPFILTVPQASSAPAHWLATLRGDTARHWYNLYRRGDSDAVHDQAAAVFQEQVTSAQAKQIRRWRRCVVIHTAAFELDQKIGPRSTSQPQWEDDGGAFASATS